MNKTDMAVAVFNKYATDYQHKFMNQDLYNDTFDVFCNSITKESPDVLELACGPGNITSCILKKRPDFKILGSDLASNMLELAKKNNPAAEFQLMDCRDIDKLDKQFDAIMCGFCLPYLSKEDAVKLIGDAAVRLHPDGVLYISTMEDDYSKSGLKSASQDERDQCYIHYHQADYLTAALTDNNFRIIDLQRKEFAAPDGTKTTDLILIARKTRSASKDRV
jgi:2-polyprenyl-3-methyl-5-hydroxy-6-metoxy-1,4-benzoquinol methylase